MPQSRRQQARDSTEDPDLTHNGRDSVMETDCRVRQRRAPRPHHKRTRSSREHRGITVKAPEVDETPSGPFAQVSARTSPK